MAKAQNGSAQTSQPRTAAIVGGGPAGLCSALLLAKRGWHVEVFERRDHPKEDAITTGQRSIVIAFMRRGIAALNEAGFELPKKGDAKIWKNNVVVGKGAMVHSPETGKAKPMNSHVKGLLFTERDAFNEALADFAKTKDRIKLNFKTKVNDIDFEARKLRCTTASGDTREFSYDLLLGCDGRRSYVRKILGEKYPDEVKYEVKDVGRSWKAFTGLSMKDLGADESDGFYFHGFARKAVRLTVWPTRFGTFGGFLLQPTHLFTEEGNTFEAYKEVIQKASGGYFPEEWLDTAAKQLVESPLGHIGTARCNTSIGPSAVLLGDAANSVTPLLGQGVNSALESCQLLVKELDKEEDIEKAIQNYNNHRHPDLQALGKLDEEGYERMGASGPYSLRFVTFQLMQLQLYRKLHRWLPSLFGQAEVDGVTDELNYARAYAAYHRDEALVKTSLALAFGATAFFAARAIQNRLQ